MIGPGSKQLLYQLFLLFNGGNKSDTFELDLTSCRYHASITKLGHILSTVFISKEKRENSENLQRFKLVR